MMIKEKSDIISGEAGVGVHMFQYYMKYHVIKGTDTAQDASSELNMANRIWKSSGFSSYQGERIITYTNEDP
jgi:hypothetical protein